MKKLVIATITAIIITTPVFGSIRSVDIQVDGKTKHTSEQPIVVDEMTLVSVEDIFIALNAKVTIKENGSYTVKFEDKEISFYVDSKEVLINGIKKVMPMESKQVNGKLMIPMRFISEAIGVNVDWNKDTNKLVLETKVTKEKVRSNENVKVMTYKEALEKAISTNSNLKNLEESFEVLETKRKDLSKDFTNSLEQGAQYVHIAGLIRAVDAYENQIKNTRLNETIIKDTTEYMLRNYIITIEGYELDIELMEEKIKLEQRDVRNLELKTELGLVSQRDLTISKQNLERSKSNLEAVKIALDKEKVGLKRFLGVDYEEDVVIEFNPTVRSINISDISSYAYAMISGSPNIEILDNAVSNAEYNLATHTGDLSETKLEVETALSKAKRDRLEAEKNMEQSIKQAYTNLQKLLENKKVLELDLVAAKENEEKMLSNFEAGLVTLNDVENSRLAILNAEMAIKKNELNYYNLIFAFEKPYLLS